MSHSHAGLRVGSASSPVPPPPPEGHFIVIAYYPQPDAPNLGSVSVQYPEDLSLQVATAAVVGAAQQLQAALRISQGGIAVAVPGTVLPPPPGVA